MSALSKVIGSNHMWYLTIATQYEATTITIVSKKYALLRINLVFKCVSRCFVALCAHDWAPMDYWFLHRCFWNVFLLNEKTTLSWSKAPYLIQVWREDKEREAVAEDTPSSRKHQIPLIEPSPLGGWEIKVDPPPSQTLLYDRLKYLVLNFWCTLSPLLLLKNS